MVGQEGHLLYQAIKEDEDGQTSQQVISSTVILLLLDATDLVSCDVGQGTLVSMWL